MMAFNLLYFVSGITTVYLEFSETVLRTFPIISTYTTTYLLSYGTPVTSEESMSRNCRLPGYLYKGTTNVTESGLTCQRWDTQTPHEQNYFVFSLAQENYCRNFDREEPWCYTTNSSVRWELCSVDVCNSPCLNQSFTVEVTSKCLSEEPATDEFCRWIVVIIKCIKRRIENSSGILCSGIEPKSIALHNQNTIEGLIGKSISQ
ncbi:plasminogen-like, partial [Saccostrea cucullata]|uniref:plasminogen-like n=1 Tax=Saccostrea cuccullata TaxID=36930 RepID=UPI002ED3970C